MMITFSKTLISACIAASIAFIAGCNSTPQAGHELGATNPTSAMTLLGASSRLVIKNADGTLCVGPPLPMPRSVIVNPIHSALPL